MSTKNKNENKPMPSLMRKTKAQLVDIILRKDNIECGLRNDIKGMDNNLNKFVYVQPETLEYCYVKLCQCCEMLFKREPNASNMRSLFISYFRMGNICIDQNRYAEAEKYYEKVLPYMEQIYKAEESFRSMREMLWAER